MKLENEWLSTAVRSLKTVKIVEKGEYDRAYKGYISSFGAAIVQSGLLSAIMFFENKGGSQADKPLIIKAIVHILTNVQTGRKHGQYNELKDSSLSLSEYVIDNQGDIKNIGLDVSNAATCLKLALRLFKEENNSKNKDDE